METRIAELKKILENAVVIDETTIPSDTVSIGSKVTVYDEEFEEDENSYSDALDLEGATRQIELPKRNAKKEEDDFSLDFINLDE